ncbi:rhodanese-like domain-containing protein [Zavarzinia compransoris]|uniref:Sulfurtransferase n=1 Tax=Zavarzinia compransoris TaxID=1264899 RepID=A0A317DXE0_9PROT|nr:rhodanese-like domain-containing protein [Zavarzinia compransoris]PWR19132.1 sulfurtransferase [Zavarzinia compransoris]TDP49144.1 rhodanese-related sulfurtransferase [Zavarzinia compransoris]
MPNTVTNSTVTEIPAAAPAEAEVHFRRKLAFETDCADVHAALAAGAADFVLLDVRGRKAYAHAHVPGAVSLPHRDIGEKRLADYPPATVFVVYCAGPHCNGADRAALRLAQLRRPVKLMIGGMTGWADEGLPFAEGT